MLERFRSRFAPLTLVLVTVPILACSEDPIDPDGDGDGDGDPTGVVLAAEPVASGLAAPTHVAAPSNDPRLFVVEQAGTIRIIENDVVLERPFLDITEKVTAGGEQGLFAIAFHPDFAENGYFYVNYTDAAAGDTRIERYTVSPTDPDSADAATAHLIMHIEQPASHHNGGQIAFGPDGFLYIAMGDGGTPNAASDLSSLLGKILRIDVNGDPYAIPADNPFVGVAGAREEIWALGLRNPWRFSIDEATDRMFIADVGEAEWEEINVQSLSAAPLDYGWNTMEGADCYQPATGCDRTGLTLPTHAYSHEDGCAVTGGFVYRGSAIPELRGHYFYSDSCRLDWLRSFRMENGEAVDHIEWDVSGIGPVVSFGQDAEGELYLTSFPDEVHRIVRVQ